MVHLPTRLLIISQSRKYRFYRETDVDQSHRSDVSYFFYQNPELLSFMGDILVLASFSFMTLNPVHPSVSTSRPKVWRPLAHLEKKINYHKTYSTDFQSYNMIYY